MNEEPTTEELKALIEDLKRQLALALDAAVGRSSRESDAVACLGFQITDDFRMVYNLRETGRYRKGDPEMENEITVGIESRFLTSDQMADVARTIKKALNDLVYPNENSTSHP